jgi:hypothetical protein
MEKYNKLDSRMDHCDDDMPEITEEQVSAAADRYDSADLACALLEFDAANEYAGNILFDVLEFCNKLKGVDVVMMEGATLNLKNIRDYARKSALLDAYDGIEKGIL